MLLPQQTLIDWPALWRGRERFTVFDADHGDGQRFRSIVQAWLADPARPAKLHVIARDTAGALPGLFRMPQPHAGLTLDLLCAPAAAGLAQLPASLDAVLLHGLQGSDWVRPLVRLCRTGTQCVNLGLDHAQQQAMAAAGFGANGFSSRQPFPVPAPRPPRQAIVVGAGLAGAAACERLCARGWQVALIERHAQAATEASGNPSGIFMPILSKDDSIPTRLSRAAFLYALRYWDLLGGIGRAFAGEQCGVLHLPRDAAFAATQRDIAQRHAFPPDFAQWLSSDAASALLKAPAPDGAWLFPRGGWANPASLCAAMLAACGTRLDARYGAGSVSVQHAGGQWLVRDAGGALLASAPVLVNAAGAAGAALLPDCALPLERIRGQVSFLPPGAVPALPLVVCRDAYMTPSSSGVVSLGASYDNGDDTALRASSHQDNLGKVAAMLGRPGLGQGAPLAGRVGFRSVAPDRLPLVGSLPAAAGTARIERLRELPRQAGLYGLLGYASRGLTWAPLAAELLAAMLDDEPLPLEAALVQAIDPGRFQLAASRRNKG